MKLIDLIRLSNARFYALEIYGANGMRAERAELDLDTEREADKYKLAKYAQAEVVRIQPIMYNSTDELALEVQLYV